MQTPPLDPNTALGLADLAKVLLIPFCGWVAWGIWKIGQSQIRIETALFGAQGDNGINGDVKELKAAERQRREDEARRQHKDNNRRHYILARLYRLDEHAGLPPMPTEDA